jgi:hypothetical protein
MSQGFQMTGVMDAAATRLRTAVRLARADLARTTSIALLAIGVVLAWRIFLRNAFLLDLPLMHFMAWRIVEGDAPYIDFQDMNGPGAYLIHVVLLQVPLPPAQAVAAFTALLTALCAAAAARMAGAGRRAPIVGAVAGLGVILWIANLGTDLNAQRDMVIAACAAGALGAVAKAEMRYRRWGIAGFLIGFAVGVKPFAAPFAILLMAAGLWLDLADKTRLARARFLVIGGAMGAFLWIALLVITGSLGGWWTTMTGFNAIEYAQISRWPLDYLIMQPQMLPAALGAAACIGAIIAFILKAGSLQASGAREHVALLALAASFALVGVVVYLVQGKGWIYQTASAGILGLIALGAAAGSLSGSSRRILGAGVVAIFLTQLPFPMMMPLQMQPPARAGENPLVPRGINWQLGPWHIAREAKKGQIVTDMVAALNALPPGMKVQPLDTTDGALHAMWLARRVQASPIVYDFHLFTGSTGSQQRARQALLKSLGETEPAILITNQGWPGRRGSGYARIHSFGELDALLGQRYRLQAEGRRDADGIVYEFRLYAPAP